MSKKKKKFFLSGSPSLPQQNEPLKSSEISQELSQEEPIEGHRILRSELKVVFLVTLVIVLAFAGLWWSNKSSKWVENFSTSMLKQLVRNF